MSADKQAYYHIHALVKDDSAGFEEYAFDVIHEHFEVVSASVQEAES